MLPVKKQDIHQFVIISVLALAQHVRMANIKSTTQQWLGQAWSGRSLMAAALGPQMLQV